MRRFLTAVALSLGILACPAPALALDVAGLQARLTRELRPAGATTGAYVLDLDTGRLLFARRHDVPRPPASVEKLYTTSTALLRLGPATTLDTEVLAEAVPDPEGVVDGNLWLRGGGDPTLSTARLRALADQLAAAGVTKVRGGVAGDGTMFDSLPGSFRTGGRFDRDMGGAIAALAVSRGLRPGGAQRDPALTAARALATALRRAGIAVLGRTRVARAPADGEVLAASSSAPVRDLVRMTNQPSDNLYAETLLKMLGAREAGAGTTRAGALVVRRQMHDFGINPLITDGSGLARSNRTTPRQVVRLLDRMDGQEVATTFRASLAVPGRSGTLRRRMRGTSAAGRCAGKTGTLNFVSALAGYCPSRDGHTVAFAFMGSGVNTFTAKKREDRMAAAIAATTIG